MRLPGEVLIRQDELRRAAAARVELGECEVPGDRTLGGDCAEMLLAEVARHGPLTIERARCLANHFRALGANWRPT